MSTRTLNLDDALYSYLLEVSVREPPLLARLRRETARHPRGRMQISPEQGQLLRFLLRLMGARRALEIGVFTGYSTLCLALALPEDGCITACDVSAEWTAVGQRYWAEAGVAASPDISPGFRIRCVCGGSGCVPGLTEIAVAISGGKARAQGRCRRA